MPELTVRVPARSQSYDIKIGGRLLQTLGNEVRGAVGSGARRAALITNKTVFELYGDRAIRSLKRAGFSVNYWLVSDGERHKSFRSLECAVEFLSDAGFERNDTVVALGGGVVGDLAGFAASIYLRGVTFVQVPTTLLAQIDSSVGGKTGINLPSGKNRAGAFHQPRLVVIDIDTLKTLPQRELTSGFCEMVKQALISDTSLFEMTVNCLQKQTANGDLLRSAEFENLIAAQCRFKASIVAGDERESTERTDTKSRRVLNFGHTTAHALETITKYRYFRHGEAVGYGMLVAGELSRNLGLIDSGDLESMREAVRLCGRLPRADHLDTNQITGALKHDKKSVGGQINWVLLEGIGRPKIVEGRLISAKNLRLSLRAGLRQQESF